MGSPQTQIRNKDKPIENIRKQEKPSRLNAFFMRNSFYKHFSPDESIFHGNQRDKTIFTKGNYKLLFCSQNCILKRSGDRDILCNVKSNPKEKEACIEKAQATAQTCLASCSK